jgi:hypothetical protein
MGKEALWKLVKAHYVFPSKHKEHGKSATLLTIGSDLRRFRHSLNMFYVQPGVSPLNRFGFITPNKWNTFQQLQTTPEAMARSNRMKELIQKIKFNHRLGPGGYKPASPLWTKKEQDLCEARILDPLEGCTLRMRNWIWGRSHIDDKGQLVTSNSDITRVIENVKDLITKEKTGEFKLQRSKDQLSAALKTEEHRGRTWAISSIASWKEGFTEDIRMYKKCGRHDIEATYVNNEEKFATLFFNFMRKHPDLIISQVSIPQINFNIGTVTPQVVPPSSSAGSAPNH